MPFILSVLRQHQRKLIKFKTTIISASQLSDALVVADYHSIDELTDGKHVEQHSNSRLTIDFYCVFFKCLLLFVNWPVTNSNYIHILNIQLN